MTSCLADNQYMNYQELASGHLNDLLTSQIEVGDRSLRVWLALTDEQKQIGLSFQSSLELDGMLFVYKQNVQTAFTFVNCDIDLNIEWFNAGGELITAGIGAAGGDQPYFCTEPFRFVLETKLTERKETSSHDNKLRLPYEILKFADG